MVATTTVAVAARKATSEIPIVAVGVADPIRTGLVATLARPGGNVTGASFNQGEIVGKWLNFIREMAPGATRVAYVTDRAHMAGYMASRDRHVGRPPPASTLMIVAGFTRPEFKVEVEVIAAGPA